jgi:hypothetical protein
LSLTTVTFSAYLVGPYPRPGNPGRVYDAHDFIDAIKGDPINGWAYVPVRGVLRRLETANRDDAIEWFGQMAADYYRATIDELPIQLVPVPNKAAVRDSGVTPRTLRLAEAIQRNIGATAIVSDVLRWQIRLARAHENGPRDFTTLYNALLMMTDDVPDDRIIILVDDMKTSGSHLQAASAELLRVTGQRPLYAYCAGRRVDAFPADSFAVVVEEIEDLEIPEW